MKVSRLLNSYISFSLFTTLLMVSLYNIAGNITLLYFTIHSLMTLAVLFIISLKSDSSMQRLILISILLTIYVLLTDATSIDLQSISRITIFFYLTILPIIASSKLSTSQLVISYYATTVALIVAGAQAFTGEPIVVGTERLAPFIGGADGLHPSAYSILAMSLLLGYVGRLAMPMGRYIHYALLCLGAIILEEYHFRTTWVMLGVIFFLNTIYGSNTLAKHTLKGIIIITAPVLLSLLLTIDLSTVETSQRLTSGRTVIWLERLGQILNSDFTTMLLGKGTGSDKSYGTLLWAYAEKDSHQDFIRITIEHGVFGLILFSIFLWMLGQRLPKGSKPIWLAIITSSLISNGVLLRPSILILFALIFSSTQTHKKI